MASAFPPMLHVELDNILTHDELASKAEEVLRKADENNQILVITRNGRPAVAVLKLEQLEELSGRQVSTNQPPVELPHMNANAVATPPPPAAPMPPLPDQPMATVFTPAPMPGEAPVVSDMPTAPLLADAESGLPDMPDMP